MGEVDTGVMDPSLDILVVCDWKLCTLCEDDVRIETGLGVKHVPVLL